MVGFFGHYIGVLKIWSMAKWKSVSSRKAIALGIILREAREDAGLSLRGFEAKHGWSKSTLGDIERGQRRLDVIELIQLCKILKIDAAKVVKSLL